MLYLKNNIYIAKHINLMTLKKNIFFLPLFGDKERFFFNFEKSENKQKNI